MSSNNGIASTIQEAQRKFLSEKGFSGRWKSVRASGIDDPCNRRLFYYLTCGEMAPEMPIDRIAIFEEGKEQEPAVRRFLSELGFEIQKVGMTQTWDKYNISGQVDGTLKFNGEPYLVEIKTVSEYAWDDLKTADDMIGHKWYQKWYGQMQIYLLLFEFKKGIFILKRKQAKEIRVLEVELDYVYAEKLLQKAEIVNKAVKENIPPDFLKNKPLECKRCPFYGIVCQPEMEYKDGILSVDDEEMATKLNKREELSSAKKEYEAIDKEIKENFVEWLTKDEAINEAFCGSFHVSVKKQLRNMKAMEARVAEVFVTKIERI